MSIKITIENKHCTVQGAPAIVCGNSGYSITFTFDEEWDQAAKKTARFSYVRDGVRKYKDVELTGDAVAVPPVYRTRELQVGVYSGDLVTSTPARIPCKKSIVCDSCTPDELDPSQYEKLVQTAVEKLAPSFTESGSVVTCEPVAGYPLTVTAPDATTITRCGANVFNYKDWIAHCKEAHPSTYYPAYEEIEYLGEKCFGYSIYRSDTSRYYTKIRFKENTQYTFRFSVAFVFDNNESYNAVPPLCIGYGEGDWEYVQVPKAYRDKFVEYKYTSKANKTIKSLFVANFSANARVYIPIDKFVIQEGTTAEYAPYLESTFAPGEPVPALPGVNTLYADSGEITVTGRADPVAIIEKLTQAVISLGANV